MANWDKTEPRGTEGIKFGAMRLRDAKAALDQALKEEHHLIDDEGTLKAIHKIPYGDSVPGHAGRVRYNPATARLEKFISDAWQGLTPQPIAAGTKMIFCQASSPVSWTQTSEGTSSDSLLRIVGAGNVSSGGVWGGSVATDRSEPFAHNHGGSTSTVQLSISANYSTFRVYYLPQYPAFPITWATATISDKSFIHPHTITNGGGHDHKMSNTWRPAYIDIITAAKD